MAEWTVSPSEGVINNNDGTFKFPSNSSYCEKEYTVTYTDEGCSCSVKVIVGGQYCTSSYTKKSNGDGGTIYPGCAGGTYTVSANVPYYYTGRSVVDCECVETGAGETSFYESESTYVSRNCGSATGWWDSEGNISFRVDRAGGGGYLGTRPINNCSAGASCEEGSGCDGHMSVSPAGSSWSTPYGQDSFEVSSSNISVDTSSKISYEVVSTTGGKSGYGWYKISFTGTESEWNSYSTGAVVGWYDVSCSKSGYCGKNHVFRINVTKG